MPLKLNISMSRKVGEPNFGSRGATVGLEMEVDSSLVEQPRELHARIARLFRLVRASVDRELIGTKGRPQASTSNGSTHDLPVRVATPAQVRAIHAIANRHEVDLAAELRSRFDVDRPENLSLSQASQLIDAIRSLKNGASSGATKAST